jgi:protease IV
MNPSPPNDPKADNPVTQPMAEARIEPVLGPAPGPFSQPMQSPLSEPLGAVPQPNLPSNASNAPVNKGSSAMKNEVNQENSSTPGWERAVLEKLAFAAITEQKARRRWKTFVWLAWLAFFVYIAFTLASKATGHKDVTQPHTAVVEIKGEIAAGAEASAELVIAAMRSAFEDEGAQAVVLLINSPGGSPVQAGLVHDEILRLKALHKKKVYAVIEEAGASGAYYIAVAADEIYADKASIVGSIGVLMDSFGATGAMEKLGVERRLLTAGENKGIGDPFSPLTPKHQGLIKTMLDQIHQQFITVVKQGRGKRLKETPETFSGLFWNGEQAQTMGLIDGLKSLDQVARDLVKADILIDYTPQENVAEKLAKRFGASLGASLSSAVPSMRLR